MKPASRGPEPFVLALALLIPLGIAVPALAQVPAISLPLNLITLRPDSSAKAIMTRRPTASTSAAPPTLVVEAPPTRRPAPTAPAPTPMPSKTAATYTVQPGDELRHIAADNHVSIWKIIEANDIPDPDSLRIGQVLNIPSD
jgi:nucleoid-associated protein YgaU